MAELRYQWVCLFMPAHRVPPFVAKRLRSPERCGIFRHLLPLFAQGARGGQDVHDTVPREHQKYRGFRWQRPKGLRR